MAAIGVDWMSAMVGASFSALPRIANQVAEDAQALEKLAADLYQLAVQRRPQQDVGA
jgi:hypothetical protein